MKSSFRAAILAAVALVSLFIASACAYAQSPVVRQGTINLSNSWLPLPETNYQTDSGSTSFACQEDHAKGIWDVRCVRSGVSWATNPSQALINTIQAAMCYYFAPPAGAASHVAPLVEIPSGSYNLGGNVSIPPGLDLEGVGGTEFGQVSQLKTTDTTQPMMTQVASETFTCGGASFTASGNGATIGNLELIGGGTAANTDIGLVNASQSDYIHNMTFTNFGGAGRKAINTGLDSSGSYLLATSNLQWYYFSGAYNPTGFTDTNFHGQLELADEDGVWDHIKTLGQLQDGGYFNRYYLTNVLLRGFQLTDSFIQIAPHNVVIDAGEGSIIMTNNRFDDGWWDSIHLNPVDIDIDIEHNWINGYCTSTTLNPANFPTNPGGITTDPNCAAIESFNLGSRIKNNSIGQSGAVWPFWSVGDVFAGFNGIGGTPSIIEQPTDVVFGDIGGPQINIGSDASKNMYGITAFIGFSPWPGGGPNIPLTNTGLGGRNFQHYVMADPTPTNYTGITGGVPDTYITIAVGPNDTITPSSSIFTCSGKPIVGQPSTGSTRDSIHTFWNNNNNFLEEVCPSGLAGSPQTTVNCSTSGTAVFGQPFSGPDYSAISIQSVACNGTASYTYPNAFTYTPSASGALSAIASTVSTTAVTVTGTGSSGFLKLEALQ